MTLFYLFHFAELSILRIFAGVDLKNANKIILIIKFKRSIFHLDPGALYGGFFGNYLI